MRRRAVIAILLATTAVVALVAFWFVAGSRNWGGLSPSANELTAQAPPDIPAVELGDGIEQVQSAATPPTKAQVEDLWQTVVTEAGDRWTPWMVVVDADTGELIAESGIDTPHTPASTMKVLTGFTALSTLDPFQTLKTGVSRVGQDLYLWGEGDLTLAAGAGDPKSPYGAAGISDLADLVADGLTDAASFNLYYQDNLFGTEKRHPAWAEQQVEDYAGDVSPYAIDTGRTAPGEWAFVPDSAQSVAAALAEALNARGISVTDPAAGDAPSSATIVAEVESAPVLDQIRVMLVESDNTMAEQFCHLAAANAGANPVDFAASTKNVVSTLQDAGVDTAGMNMLDCSGLDSGSKIPPRVLLETIQASLESEGPQRALTRMLPISGLSGTLADRLGEESTRANFSAKTGSLGGAATLVGVGTTKSGADLIILVGSDDVPENGAWFTKYAIDGFVEELLAL